MSETNGQSEQIAAEQVVAEEPKEPEKTTQEPEKPKEPEKPQELEADAPDDSGSRLSPDQVSINVADSTLNVLPIQSTPFLATLSEGGMQYLLAGARATVGLKSGRYMFEVRVVENIIQQESHNYQGAKPPVPRDLVKIGFSLAGSSLFLDTAASVCFDSEGNFCHDKKRERVDKKATRFGKDIMTVLLNLDSGSPNFNTISLFRNGVRASPPQSLPENLRGQALYPAVVYRNVTLDVNFGPVARCPLPFSCRMVSDATVTDVECTSVTPPADGNYEVVFPVGLPDRGFFDFVDNFLAQNPQFTELSDRSILEWAAKSGFFRPKNTMSNDKPTMTFGIPAMDDLSVRKVLATVAPLLPRNFVVAELKANLVASDRKSALSSFSAPHFKKAAVVLVGEPDAEHKQAVQKKVLHRKTLKVMAERKKQAAEAERKRLIEVRVKKAEEAKKARLAKEKGETVEEATEEDPPAVAEENVEPVELDEEEKKIVFLKSLNPDMSEKVLAKAYANFSLPSSDEGFAEVRYVWASEPDAAQIMTKYVLEQKVLQRAEDLVPGEWFKAQWADWQKKVQEWKKTQGEWKDPIKKKALLKKKEEEAAKAEGEDAKKAMEVDMEELDVHGVENVNDVGSGEPLFANFAFEDWALLAIRYELHLLVHAFKKDLNDPDRLSFGENHLAFYFTKYFKKQFTLASFNVKSFDDLVKLIKDSLELEPEKKLLKGKLDDDTPFDKFVKLAEIHRRDRARRVDAGDETALLKFPRTGSAPTAPTGKPPQASVRPQVRPTGSIGLTPAGLQQKRPAGPGWTVPSAPAWKAPKL